MFIVKVRIGDGLFMTIAEVDNMHQAHLVIKEERSKLSFYDMTEGPFRDYRIEEVENE